MTKDKEIILYNKYSDIGYGEKDIKKAWMMSCECDDGWFILIDDCLDNIKRHLINKDKEFVDQFYLCQIKEKFGILMIYVSIYDDYIRGLIDMVQSLSMITCEVCGSHKDIGKTKGWIKTVCEKCVIEKNLTNWKKNE